MRIYLVIIFIIGAFTIGKAQSVLNKSGLIKIATLEEGIHKIDRSFLEGIGLNPNQINPNTIQVFGMPGGHIPQENAVTYPMDPQPISMEIHADNNESFDTGEAIYFYADAVQNIHYNFDLSAYEYSSNLYADSLYFFIDLNAQSPKLIKQTNISAGENAIPINWYEEVYFHEENEVNILRSGREWYGESFSLNKSQEFRFELTNQLASGKQISLHTSYLAQTYQSATLNISLNGFTTSAEPMPTVLDFTEFPYRLKGELLSNKSQIATSILNSNELLVKIDHIQEGSGKSDGYLDYIFMTVPQQLVYQNRQMVLRNKELQQVGNYSIIVQGLSNNHEVWNVSDPLNALNLSNQDGTFAHINLDGLQEQKLVIFNQSDALQPTYISTVNSQNLKGGEVPDLLIITYDAFADAANQLATYRRSHNNFTVEVAETSKIFNEFGGGRQDITAIRNYIRYFYQQNPSKLKYVLLLGAASYDFKDRVASNTNFVPVYQSRNSLHPIFTFASDDYYGFMDEDEGFWSEDFNNVDDVDVGIGRIPAKTLQEAQNAVQKIKHYETNPNVFNKWRNDIYFIADDEDGNLHHRDAENLSEFVINNFGFFNINKLFLGTFQQEVFASTQRSPKMRDAINDMIEKGALIVNYTGHGSEESWANEGILTKSMVREWRNMDRLPLFVTATCEYGRYDNPVITSGAQEMLLLPSGGAIALLTTTRPVESSSNARMNESFFEGVFNRQGGPPRKLGDVIKDTKNFGISGVKNRNFVLLGDPALTLAEPTHEVSVAEILTNDEQSDTLKSMSKITVVGEIQSYEGQKLTDFQGVLTAELFDKPIQKSTTDPASAAFTFPSFESILYRGNSSIKNGQFEFTFYVPKEMNYKIDAGKFSLYAKPENGTQDANGFYDDFLLGGSIIANQEDNIGPDIALFLNDKSFNNGDKVGSEASLVVNLFDEHGISISQNSLNPGITYELDGKTQVQLNDFFTYELDSYQQGTVRYNLKDMEKGKHSLTVYAKDIYNNSSQATITFEVVGNENLQLIDFVVYPNPANKSATFRVRHNRKNDQVAVTYQIVNSMGKPIFEREFLSEGDFREDIWNLTGNTGIKVTPGLYFIRIIARSIEDQAKTEQIKKLIVIN